MIDELEHGEARWAGGRVVAVYDRVRQGILQADVAIGSVILGPLDDLTPFNPAGGDVAVTLPEAAGPLVFTYDAIDEVAQSLHLISNGAGVVLTAGSTARPDPALVDRTADVREGTQGDPIACRVPYAMRPWLPVGTRTEEQGEEILYGPTTGAGYVLHDVLGSIPLLPEGSSAIGDMPVGTMMAWGTPTLPARWLACDGSVRTMVDYPELGALLGNRYGGDGTSTFGLPNLTNRFPRGAAVPGTSSDVDAHAHGSAGLTTSSEPAHDHGSGNLANDNPGSHDHGGGGLNTGSQGGHDHGSSGGHGHSAGSLNTGGPGGQLNVTIGSAAVATVTHQHSVGGSTGTSGTHGHGSSGSHSHGVTGTTGGGGGHSHAISGRVGTSNAHTHNVTGTSPSVQHLPPFLDLVWIIKATPGGDPLADGTYIEVRDEGIPDVPTATALDFRGAGVNVDPSGPVAIVTIGAQAGVTDHGALTGLADDDHLQYLTNARGDVRYAVVAHAHAALYEPLGAVATHAAAADPHPAYLTTSEGNAAYEPVGAVAAHAAVPDPHAGYATDSEVATAISTHVASDGHPDVLGELSDVEVAGAAQGDRLTYRGGVWHPEPASTGGAVGVGSSATFATVAKGTNQAITSGAGAVGIALTAEQDPLGLFDPVNDRFVLPEGVWVVHFSVSFAAAGTRSGRTFCIMSVDGSTFRRSVLGIDVVPQSDDVSAIIVVPEATSRTVGLTVSHNNGANLTVESTANSNGATYGEATLIGALPPSYRLPVITIEVAPSDGPAPLDVDAHATNVGGQVTAYDWNWGDATAHGTGADASHTYTAAGTYTVTCTATGPKGTDVETQTVDVT